MSDTHVIPLVCACGKFQGQARLDASNMRFVCYCDDCQAYARYLGQEERMLDAAGGTEITPVVPARLKLAGGAREHLACVRLSETGMYRWHTSCCRSPVGNTPASHHWPYVGMVASIFRFNDDAERARLLGPVRLRTMGKDARGTPPAGTHPRMPVGGMFIMLKFMIPAFLRRQQRPSPFFVDGDVPLVPPRILTPEENLRLHERAR